MGLVERLTEAQLDTIEKHGVGIGEAALLVREVREARAGRSDIRTALSHVSGALCDAVSVRTDPPHEGIRELITERDAARAERDEAHARGLAPAHTYRLRAEGAESALEAAREEVQRLRAAREFVDAQQLDEADRLVDAADEDHVIHVCQLHQPAVYYAELARCVRTVIPPVLAEVREARADGLRLQAEVERLRYALQQVVARAPVSMEWAIDFARIAMRKAGE